MRSCRIILAASAAFLLTVEAETSSYSAGDDISLDFRSEDPNENDPITSAVRKLVSYWPRFERHGTRDSNGRRLANATGSHTDDAVWQAVIGSLTVVGGTQIQPCILLINGFIAAEVGVAWKAMVEDVTPERLIAVFLAILSGFSIGTVGIQNMPFQSVLQGGVLFSSAFQVTVKDPLKDWLEENTSGDVKKWLTLAADSIITGIGSYGATIFKALGKVVNSAYLSATMAVKGWITIIEDISDEKVPEWVEVVATVVVMLFCFWWHSLILAQQRVASWAVTKGVKKPVQMRGTTFIERMKAFGQSCVAPFQMFVKCMQGGSVALGTSFNLKGEPQTFNQIVINTCNQLGLPPPQLIFAKFGLKFASKKLVGVALTKAGKSPQDIQKTTELTQLICGALDVESMRAIVFKIREGTGDFTGILDKLFGDVMIALQTTKHGALGQMTPDQLKAMWHEGKVGIREQIEGKVRGVITSSITKLLRVKDVAEKEYIDGLCNSLDLQEMATIINLLKSGRFSFQDLQTMAEAKAEEMAEYAKHLAYRKARSMELKAQAAVEAKATALKTQAEEKAAPLLAEAKKASDAVQGAQTLVVDVESKDAPRTVATDGAHETQPVDQTQPVVGASADAAIAQTMLEKSYEQAPGQLAEALLDVINLKEGINKIPVLGQMINGAEAAVRNTVNTTLGPIPYVGPTLINMGYGIVQQVKKQLVSKSMAALIKANGIPLALVADVVKKFAEKDEYLDDMLEQIINPAALKAMMEDYAEQAKGQIQGQIAQAEGQIKGQIAQAEDQIKGQAAKTAGGDPTKPKKIPEPTGIPGLIMDQINKYGPGACRDKLMHCLTHYFDVDLDPAKEFVHLLTPKDLLSLGQAIMTHGFDFERCTELIKNKVHTFVYSVPVRYLEDGLEEDELSIQFSSCGKPPTIIGINEDWVGQVKDITGEKNEPHKGDRLVALANQCAAEYTKDAFDAALQDAVAKAKEEEAVTGDEGKVLFKFDRGLDIDVAEEFRRVLPSVMRKYIGIPFAQGRAFARNLTLVQMKKVVMILLTGGLKKLDDLAIDLQVEVNFEQAFKSQMPIDLSKRFGFSLEGAKKFIATLDPADGMGLNSLMVRFQQMVGFGDMETMFVVLVTNDVNMLDNLHNKRYKPRNDLSRLLKEDPVETGKRTNLVVTEKGGYELWQEGAKVGTVSVETVEIVLKIWRENQTIHADDDRGPIRDVPLWSSYAVVEALQNCRTEPAEIVANKEFFKWPEYVIDKAGLNEQDTEVAFQLFFRALAEARQDVWTKYENKLLHEAAHCLGPGEHEETEAQEEAAISREVEHNEGVKAELKQWFRGLMAALPKRGPRRTQPLLQIEKAIKERDTFRLTKIANKYGIKEQCPTAGLEDQLKKDLSSLPIDLTQNANELAAFISTENNPLTRNIKKKRAPAGDAPTSAKSTTSVGAKDPSCQPTPQVSTMDVEAPTKDTSQFSVEQKHETAVPFYHDEELDIDIEASWGGYAPVLATDAMHSAPPPENNPKLGVISSTPCNLFAAGAQTGISQGPPKLKDLFTLSKSGDFDVLAKFSASRCPGGPKEVAATMRKKCFKMLQKNYGMDPKPAMKFIDKFCASLHFTVEATKLKEDKPKKDEPMPEKPEDRDGADIGKHKRVTIVPNDDGSLQQEEFNGILCGRVSRPALGWIPMNEVKLLPENAQEEQEERAMKNVARLLRGLKEYDISTLQDESDEFNMGVDFVGLAVDRIVRMVLRLTKGAYHDRSVESQARKVAQKNMDVLEQSLVALNELNVEFVIEALQLPPPPPPKPKAQKKERCNKAGLELKKLEALVEKLTYKLEKKHVDLTDKDDTLAQKIKECDELREQVDALRGASSSKLRGTPLRSSKTVNLQEGQLDGEWFAKDGKDISVRGRINGTSLTWPGGNTTTMSTFGNTIRMQYGGETYDAFVFGENEIHWSDGDQWIRKAK